MRAQFILLVIVISLFSCIPDEPTITYTPTPAPLKIPEVFKDRVLPPYIPKDNPQTKEGIALGKKLFYDPILSADHTLACASCHQQASAFTNNYKFAKGIDKLDVKRNTIPLFNTAWNYKEKLTWDGHGTSIEFVAKNTITDPLEMHNTWDKAVDDLQNDKDYPELYKKAFGTDKITEQLTSKALAQFIRTITSSNSKFDNFLLEKDDLTFDERMGYIIFEKEEKGDCFHCHGGIYNPLWTDNLFHNNGLDAEPADVGLEGLTGDQRDRGKFKTPTLRNLIYTAPYMHDGRFKTLDEVINFYSEGVQISPTIDPLMEHSHNGGVHLTDIEKKQLKAFLLTLTDESLISNKEYNK